MEKFLLSNSVILTYDVNIPTCPHAVTDEDAEDREEQGLFEQDNTDIVSTAARNDSDANEVGTAEAAYALRNDGEDNTTVTNNSQDDYTDPGPLYIQSATSGESWELTWPIWHMLPRDERRAIATQHGMKSIGEFEEYMTLTRAVGESEGGVDGNRGVVPLVENNDSAGNNIDGRVDNLSSDSAVASLDPSASTWQPPFIAKIEEEVEDDDDSCASTTLEENNDPTVTGEHADSSNSAEDVDLDDHLKRIRLGGLPCSIPDEILHKAFAYLPIDDHANLALVSPYWSRFTRCESLYKTLCERIYLNQSKRKTLHVSKFGNSYRNMLEMRPRVRTGGGLYVLKYQKVRKIERDMWTEIPVGAILESVYYRYLYFFEDGRVMYALTHATPVVSREFSFVVGSFLSLFNR